MQTEHREQKRPEKTIVIDIRLTRGLVAFLIGALLLTAGLGYLAFGLDQAAASSPMAPDAGSTGLRQYYLTIGNSDGASASSACASGFHMASMWEILDPSNLEYNLTLGTTSADMGYGPPGLYGWVRTGWGAETMDSAGEANCDAWSSNSGSHYGSIMNTEPDWDHATGIPNWNTTTQACNYSMPVWCVED